MNKDKVIMFSDDFEVETSNGDLEKVEGVTILISGQFKDVLEILTEKNNLDNKELIKEALFNGISSMIQEK